MQQPGIGGLQNRLADLHERGAGVDDGNEGALEQLVAVEGEVPDEPAERGAGQAVPVRARPAVELPQREAAVFALRPATVRSPCSPVDGEILMQSISTAVDQRAEPAAG